MKIYLMVVLVVVVGCARQAPEGDQTAAVQEATFRFQFERNASVQQRRAGVYFLAFGNPREKEASDPSEAFLARFAGHSPRVSKYSNAESDGGWVIDQKTKEGGVIFYVHDVKITGPFIAEAMGGYREAGLSGSGNTFHLKYGWRGWRVTESSMNWIAKKEPPQTTTGSCAPPWLITERSAKNETSH